MKHGKHYQEFTAKLEPGKLYSPEEAIKFLIANHPEKFDASLEVHCNLGIDPKKSDQQIRGNLTLPHGTGKSLTVAAFVNADKTAEAKEAGADLVGGEELIAEIKKTEKTNFDVAVASPEMMPKLGQIAKILGTRGLMPTPKNETVTMNLKKTIGELKKGKVNFKNDVTCNIHQAIGKVSFGPEKLLENFNALLDSVKKAKPASSKGTYLKSVTLCTSMSPGVRVQVN